MWRRFLFNEIPVTKVNINDLECIVHSKLPSTARSYFLYEFEKMLMESPMNIDIASDAFFSFLLLKYYTQIESLSVEDFNKLDYDNKLTLSDTFVHNGYIHLIVSAIDSEEYATLVEYSKKIITRVERYKFTN